MDTKNRPYHDFPKTPRRLVVTGAGGQLGHWICRLAVRDWSVFGIYRHHPVRISDARAVKADLTCIADTEKWFSVINPHAVIHAAAVSQPAICEAEPSRTDVINVSVPRHLATLCTDKGIPFLFTSTDLVFDGLHAPYDEQCPVNPQTVYGRQKVQAEVGVLEDYPGALVCRMPLMFGQGHPDTMNFSMQMLSAIRNRRPIRLFTDEYRTPVDFQSAAQGLLAVLGQAEGVLHLGGKIRLSRFEMGQLMARQMGMPTSMLEPVSIHTVPSDVARSADCSLISDTAYGLGYEPAPLPAALKRFSDRFHEISKR